MSFNKKSIMFKNILLLFCFCLVAVLLMIHYLPKQVGNLPAFSKDATILPVSRSKIAVTLGRPVAETILGQADQTSNGIVTVIPAIMNRSEQTNTATDDGNEKAEQEKYRLLRELRELAVKDPETALAGAMKLPVGDERNQALAAVCAGLAQTDPADAVKTAQTLHLDEQPGAILENLVQQWAATDMTSALAWADSQPAGDQRDGLTTRVAYVMSQTDPASAANLVFNQIPSGPAQDEAVMTVLNQWANQNLVAASVWVKGFPEGPLQERAVNEIQGIMNHQQALVRQ